jgi:CubicO group peptidase (beta-lactamase class C family)
MNEEDVPGVSIALIRDHQIVWTEGFGLTNRIAGRQVTPEAVFEVASISKAVTGYTALRVMEREGLTLDDPVHLNLEKQWLPPSDYSERITLRHLLSHSSGLGEDPLFQDRSIRFEPGTEFLYSGTGSLYLQEWIEQTTGESLEEAARGLVFNPLGMSQSSFVDEAGVMAQMANGHMRYVVPLLVFLIPFSLITVVVGIVVLIMHRIIKKRWRLSWQLNTGLLVLAFVLTEILIYSILGEAFPNLIWVTIVCGVVFLGSLLLSYIVARRLVSLVPTVHQKRVLRVIVLSIWMVSTVMLILRVAESITGPVPKNYSSEPSAIGSLRSTAPDLARFLVEMSRPRYLSESITTQIDSGQVTINQDFSWGLGIGIQHTEHGDALWQNGITLAFRSVIVMYPEQGHGVVVLSNSETGLPVAYDIAEQALGGRAKWKFF